MTLVFNWRKTSLIKSVNGSTFVSSRLGKKTLPCGERWRKLTWVNRLSPVQKEEGCELGAGVPFGALGKQSSIKF
ncbi:hypothetical protein DPMN_181301 [Dreissena polymorpha]|uniref:Uncharacterized protein n=1 Tax=Dreissena polymorpha TaxID=45954 RepID=A0A9D4DFZ5_DREPO|nr:hypothetical protein DPMN_181301 [Dreissena polymorpha]